MLWSAVGPYVRRAPMTHVEALEDPSLCANVWFGGFKTRVVRE